MIPSQPINFFRDLLRNHDRFEKNLLISYQPIRGTSFIRSVYRSMLVFVMLITSIGAECNIAKADNSIEYAVKGAYLFKFSAYVEWPPQLFSDATSPFVIGILGEDPFGKNLEEIIRNRTVQSRPIVIRRYKNVEQVKGTHILYISSTELKNREQINTSLNGATILTVSESTWGPGSIINFIVQENKVRFEIDPKAAENAGLKLSSKLLSIAKVKP